MPNKYVFQERKLQASDRFNFSMKGVVNITGETLHFSNPIQQLGLFANAPVMAPNEHQLWEFHKFPAPRSSSIPPGRLRDSHTAVKFK